MFNNFLLSVIIPVKNGEATLEKCLCAIKNQTISGEVEIIILDSCSTDKSVIMAESFGARIITIPNGTFNHGLTRNEGVKYANGKFLYYTVQDAYLAENDHLEKMVAHFADAELQAVVGMQAVPLDKNKNPAFWFKRISSPVTVFKHFAKDTFASLSLQDQYIACAEWDDVNAMYRKSILQRVPFIKTDFAEDKFWAADALKAGYKIAFDPSLVVYHYHHYDFKYAFKVEYTLNYALYKYFRLIPALPPFIKPLLIAIYRIWKNQEVSFVQKIYWSFHSFLGLTGNQLSHVIFIVIGRLFGANALEDSFNFFCSQTPQGKIKEGDSSLYCK